MAIVRPAITGDIVQDSWADQVTRAINAGTIGSGGGGGGIGGGSGTGPAGVNGFNAATIYLFRRSLTETPPDTITVSTTYTYETGVLADDDNGNTGDPAVEDDDITGWYRAIPDEADGEYTWTIQVSVADQEDSDTIAPSTWSAVTLLSRPGQDAVTVTVEARAAIEGGNTPDWVSLSNTVDASPNFKNDTAKEIGLVVKIYEAGTEVADAVYIDADTTYVWTKNGVDFTPNVTQVTGTGKDMRVLLINEMDVAEGNINEVFTCRIDY